MIGLVTARGGSKGFPNKNIAQFNGMTLLEHAIDVGLKSDYVDDVYISTDSQQYLDIAMKYGANSYGLRSKRLSSDSALSIDVIKDFIKNISLGDDSIIVLLQPTSPIRTAEMVDSAVKKCQTTMQSVVTVAKVDEPNPYKLKKIDENGNLKPFIEGASSELPRQQLPSVYQLTGAIYVSTVGNILKNNSLFSEETKTILMDDFSNIDDELDLEFLKFRYENGLRW
ncbi:acylneuraminate cytidylyltransferase family protein [Vibrio sp. THAF190c]|uniref:acylneuraminate cytidylyltransferase family protein n=1 Tax=Vibrio sp. THAF190c TaxID=2587865 RepID=UPI001561F58A|nr:acylneuraminate cytidylyltransferase family protein [Vibrio sp. THAF190c]